MVRAHRYISIRVCDALDSIVWCASDALGRITGRGRAWAQVVVATTIHYSKPRNGYDAVNAWQLDTVSSDVSVAGCCGDSEDVRVRLDLNACSNSLNERSNCYDTLYKELNDRYPTRCYVGYRPEWWVDVGRRLRRVTHGSILEHAGEHQEWQCSEPCNCCRADDAGIDSLFALP